MAAVAVAATAAATAGLAYIDGKFHIRQDLANIRAKSKAQKLLVKAEQEKRTSLYYLFEAHAQRKPNAECLWWRPGSYSWAETYYRVNQYAQFFLRRGVQPGDLVGLFMANSPDFVMAWLGLFAIGAAPAMINHNLARDALLHCIALSNTPLILADGRPELLARIDGVEEELAKQGVKVVRLSEVKGELNNTKGERPPDKLREKVNAGSPAGLFYTSGTTGMPKACFLPIAPIFLAGVVRETAGFFPLHGDNERYYDCMPLYHGTGGISGMQNLLAGSTLCIARKFSVTNFWQDIRDSRATWFAYVGETLRYLLAAPPSPRDKDHNVHSIYGNGLRPDVWKAFRDRFGIIRIVEFFNSTEGMLQLLNPARGDFNAESVGHHGLLLRNRYHNTYIPVEIDHESGDIVKDPKTGFAKRVPYEVGGEILVAQPSPWAPSFKGYYRNEEATEKRFVKDVFQKGDVYYRTGDALRRDEDGRWFFLDRLGDTFRWKGENVSTAEVAETVGKYPGVVEAIVYGVGLPGHDGKAGMAAVLLDPSTKGNFDYNGLLKHLRTHLPKYAVPIFIRELQESASSHNNKQNKLPLKNAGVDPSKVKSDRLLWISDNGSGESYVSFGQREWDYLNGGKAKL